MKSKLLIVTAIYILFTLLLSGCSDFQSSYIQVGTYNTAISTSNETTDSQPEQSIIHRNDITAEDDSITTSKSNMDFSSDTTGIGENETLEQLQDKGFTLIPEHSFDINLENWGNVKFVSGFQEDSFKIPKLGLYLVDSGGIIQYSFPEFYGNMWVLFEVDAVAFKDANGDGLKDIIIIADYILGHGENAAEEFPVSGVYFQKDKKFINLPELDDEMNSKNINDSISQVIKYVEKKHIDINGM